MEFINENIAPFIYASISTMALMMVWFGIKMRLSMAKEELDNFDNEPW